MALVVLNGTPGEVARKFCEVVAEFPGCYTAGYEWINEKEIRMPVFLVEEKNDSKEVAAVRDNDIE
jgi:hypothetical protein